MEKPLLRRQLERATEIAIEFARRYCHQRLLGPAVYLVLPNQSFDENRSPDDVVFPDDARAARDVTAWPIARVVDWMCRDGRVPVWVDVSVFNEGPDAVVMQLLCAGRWSANPERLCYQLDGNRSPFGIKSPPLPRAWQEGDKFDIGWHVDRGD